MKRSLNKLRTKQKKSDFKKISFFSINRLFENFPRFIRLSYTGVIGKTSLYKAQKTSYPGYPHCLLYTNYYLYKYILHIIE